LPLLKKEARKAAEDARKQLGNEFKKNARN